MTANAQVMFGLSPWPEEAALPAVWRDLDRALWRWVRTHGGDPLLAELAGWASHADGQGHSALPLVTPPAPYPQWDPQALAALQHSPLVTVPGVSDGGPPRPFVLDAGMFYLYRNYRAEVDVAQALRARRMAAQPAQCPPSEADLRALFHGRWTPEEALQRAAVAQAPGRRLLVLTGGPGTGKTTTVLRMLLALSREYAARSGADLLPQVRLAAPTGKAAQRLGDALRQGVARLALAQPPLPADWHRHLQALAQAESATVHRLLGSRARPGGFAHHAGARLPADIVVVDEASMLDLSLLRALLAALREDAVLVLVGDADQLTSVGTGSVLMDIVQALENDPRDDLVRLQHCFRADATLVPILAAVRAGDPAAFQRALDQAGAVARWHPVDTTATLRRHLQAWAETLARTLTAAAIDTPVAAIDAETLRQRLALLRQRQLLCAQRDGPFGAVQAAALIAARLRARAPGWGERWYPGRSVMITRNDPAARLYNGDVGLCLPVDIGGGEIRLRVLFDPAEQPVADAAPPRLFEPDLLPPHEDAFAITVHKSQGSEYGHVAVLLPPDVESPLLSRQTLYTGLSRAQHSLELWSSPPALARALHTVLHRHGRLAARMGGG
jgi:exodeoxyribonuclease V alpha subunit